MHHDVRKFILECSDCQHTKYVTQREARLLQPFPIPSQPWTDLALDCIIGLSPYHGCTVILVVVDHFSKGGPFGMLPTHFTAFKTAQLFLDMIFKLQSFPKSFISDMDPIFMSVFWQELFRLNDTKLRMSTSYHP